jgi:hypothetical protein
MANNTMYWLWVSYKILYVGAKVKRKVNFFTDGQKSNAAGQKINFVFWRPAGYFLRSATSIIYI